MAHDHTQKQLEEMINGKPQIANAVFYEQAMLDHAASKTLGRRVYIKTVFIKVTQPGITDWASYMALPADFANYPEEYETFLNNKQGTRVPGVDIIPGLDIAHLQELIDIGLATIPQLAEALQVPPHLEYAKQSAIAFNLLLKETPHAEEEGNQESSVEEAGFMPAPDRQDHPVDLSRRAVPTRYRATENDDSKRIHQGGRYNGGEDTIDNWKVEQDYKVVI